MCTWNNSPCRQRNLVVECRATLQQLDQDQPSLAEPSAGQCDRASRNDQNHKCWRPKFLLQCLHMVPAVQNTKTKFQLHTTAVFCIYGKTNVMSMLAAPVKLPLIRNFVFPRVQWFSCILLITIFVLYDHKPSQRANVIWFSYIILQDSISLFNVTK